MIASSFNDIPPSTRRPWAWIEFDASKAEQGPSLQEHKILVVGLRKSGGAISANIPKVASSADEVASLFGANTMLVEQADALFANNKVQQATFIGTNAPTAGASAGTFTITGPATAAGDLVVYVGDKRFPISVASGDSATVIGDAIEAAINADTVVPWTAANVTGTVTVTAEHHGTWGNSVEFLHSYYRDETTPDGVGITVVKPGSGTGTIDFSAIWAILGDTQFTHIAIPPLATAELVVLEAELDDRWGPERQIDAHVYMGINDTYANLVTLGSVRNSPHTTFIGLDQAPSAPHKLAAALCGVACKDLAIDPARPLQTLEVKGILPPLANDQFTRQERNLLLFDGISVFDVTSDGRLIIERVITGYQTNAFGAADTAYLDLNTKATLSYLRYDFRTGWQLTFPRHKLRADGDRIPNGQAIITPNIARGHVVAWFRQMEALGLVEGVDQFKRDLIIEINASDPNRLDIKMSPNLMNQLRVLGMQINFLL